MAIYSNITIDQGSDFELEIDVADATGNSANLTGYTVAGQIRKSYSSSTATDLTCTFVNAAQGTVKIALTNAVTNAMKAGRYVYDVEVNHTATSVKTRIVEGQAEITPGVTQ
ncbi:MAG: hypothetical protein CMD98_04615 [Gammaproteobacteria bacterium]|nr:hypothetical protein [Gammaproteobacteria bacterium]|tara:strand:- start:3649 stop:3984 length:336 start_codon:yes stop_codon:yes gene_type:complete